MSYSRIAHVLPNFQFQGSYECVEELLAGHINNTYRLTYRLAGGERVQYTLQRINRYVFKDPPAMMHNIERVCEHLRACYLREGISPTRRMIDLVRTQDGLVVHEDQEQQYWRAYRYVDHATAHNRPKDAPQFMQAGRGFGEFMRRLYDFPAQELHETIPNFHNTPKRFFAFVTALDRDNVGRAAALEPEIDFLFDRRKTASAITDQIRNGALPLRVTHNDTKINNVLIDDDTHEAICVIDLDTVMPGSALYDFGDATRFGASTAAEDEADVSKVGLDIELFTQFAKGYLSEVKPFLSQAELGQLPLGLRVITYEQVLRFLTDYIDGDLYFKVKSPEHNLLRARAQMALLMDIDRKYDQLCEIVEGLLR